MTDGVQRFTGDRYDRLAQGAAVLAADPAVNESSYPFDSAGLHALVATISECGLLDHLDDHTCNTVVALFLLDFHRGITGVASRILGLLAQLHSADPPACNSLAVISGLGGVLALVVDTAAWGARKPNYGTSIQVEQ